MLMVIKWKTEKLFKQAQLRLHTTKKKVSYIQYYDYEMIFFFSFEQEILVPKDFEAGGSRMIIGAGTFNKVKAQITGKTVL